ncbi:hypothetical protein KSP35_00020 [Aquihabitans sp. G128]|uniref:hypothetical protein n=1 Tax=Aquihabitans sp. G128 TaxID=2849779 RepID=UPI001C221C77|nr:hypothetical protein [Aquihabitans sp. G128]QXC63627.1 hypothetical protein KSP35_00020 [Aquihabitans sp. G128]
MKGGATSPGVTADTITVVAHESPDDDLAASLQAQLDPADKREATGGELLKLVQDRFSMWGRKLKIVPVQGHRLRRDLVAPMPSRWPPRSAPSPRSAGRASRGPWRIRARQPRRAVPGLQALGPDSTFQKNAPYCRATSRTPEQYLLTLGDYLIGRLNGRKAEFAGDPALRKRKRVFVDPLRAGPPVFGQTEKVVAGRGAKLGYKDKVSLTYQLVVAELAERPARSSPA